MFPSGGNDKGPSVNPATLSDHAGLRGGIMSGILVEAGGNSDDAFQLTILQDWLNQYIRRFALS
jgi:hypothetical protein